MTAYPQLLDAYSATPTPAALAALRAHIRASPNFDADLVPLEVIGPLASMGQHSELVTALSSLMPGALLSPSAHAGLAGALRRSGDPEGALREASLSRLALDSILSTGDGSSGSPYSVLRISDEYDVVLCLGRRTRSQALVEERDRTVDRHSCTDGSTLFFDVTDLAAARS